MASLTLTIPDEQVQRVVDAFAADGVTGAAGIRQELINYIKKRVFQYEKNEATKQAVETVRQNVSSAPKVDVS